MRVDVLPDITNALNFHINYRLLVAIMDKCNSNSNQTKTMTVTELSIVTERLHYLLQAITENNSSLEHDQRFCLLEIAWEISLQVNKWARLQELSNDK